MVIGVAGKTCAGKNTVTGPLEQLGFYHIDMDKLGHAALEHQKEKVFAAFGPAVQNPDGTVNRRALGGIVFADPAAKATLEGIVHPEMVQMAQEIIAKKRNAVINAALLFEMQLDRLCDMVFWVEAPAIVRFFRGIKRDKLSSWAMMKRIWAQRKMNPNTFLTNADIITIRNNGNRARTAEKVAEILEKKGITGK